MDIEPLFPWLAVLLSVQVILQLFAILDLFSRRSFWAYWLLWLEASVLFGLIGAAGAYLIIERRKMPRRLKSLRAGMF